MVCLIPQYIDRKCVEIIINCAWRKKKTSETWQGPQVHTEWVTTISRSTSTLPAALVDGACPGSSCLSIYHCFPIFLHLQGEHLAPWHMSGTNISLGFTDRFIYSHTDTHHILCFFSRRIITGNVHKLWNQKHPHTLALNQNKCQKV